MKTYLIETSLTVTLRRVFEVEAETAEDAEELFANGEHEDGPISEETVKVVGDEYIVSTEEKEEPDLGETVTLRFRPQAWVNDYAVGVDPETPDTWQVPKSMLLERFSSEQDWLDRDNDRDDMRHEGTAPKWVRDWSGPFEVDLADEHQNPWGDVQ